MLACKYEWLLCLHECVPVLMGVDWMMDDKGMLAVGYSIMFLGCVFLVVALVVLIAGTHTQP